MVTLQSQKDVFFMVTNIQKKKFCSLNICPLGVWICFLFNKFCIFTFLPFLFYFFAPAAQFSCGFWALAHSSFNIQNFNGLLKRGSMRFFRGMTLVCMRRKKNRPKKINIFCLFFDWGQPNSNLVFIFILGRSSLILS